MTVISGEDKKDHNKNLDNVVCNAREYNSVEFNINKVVQYKSSEVKYIYWTNYLQWRYQTRYSTSKVKATRVTDMDDPVKLM